MGKNCLIGLIFEKKCDYWLDKELVVLDRSQFMEPTIKKKTAIG